MHFLASTEDLTSRKKRFRFRSQSDPVSKGCSLVQRCRHDHRYRPPLYPSFSLISFLPLSLPCLALSFFFAFLLLFHRIPQSWCRSFSLRLTICLSNLSFFIRRMSTSLPDTEMREERSRLRGKRRRGRYAIGEGEFVVQKAAEA